MRITRGGLLKSSDAAGAFPSAWSAGMTVSAGQAIISPTGSLVTAISAHTTGSVYNPALYRSARRSGTWIPTLVTNRASQDGIIGAQANQSVYDASTNRTYLVYLGQMRRLHVTYYDHATQTFARPEVVPQNYALPLDDNHGIPSCALDDTGRLHIVWGVHNALPLYAKMTNVGDITAWTTSTLSVGNGTYHTLVAGTGQNMYILFRSGGSHASSYPAHEFGGLLTSSNRGSTWTEKSGGLVDLTVYNADAAKDFYSQAAAWVNGRLYFAWTVAHGASHDGSRSDWFCAYYDPTSGHVFTLDGTDRGAKLGATQADLLAARAKTHTYGGGPMMVANTDGTVLLATTYQDTGDNFIYSASAKWDGSTWTVNTNIGTKTNHVGHVPGLRRRSDGVYEYFGLTGINNLPTGAIFYNSTAAAEPVPAVRAGLDLVVFTSTDGVTWSTGANVLTREQVRGPGVRGVTVPLNSSDDLKAFAIGVLASTATGTSGGNTGRRLPIYALSDSNVDPVKAALSFGHPGVLIEYYDAIATAAMTTAWAGLVAGTWTKVDLSAVIPLHTTEVLLRMDMQGTSGQTGGGGMIWRFPDQTTTIGHGYHRIDKAVLTAQQGFYWVPVDMDGKVEVNLISGTTLNNVKVCGARVEQ